jgi:predicted SprT family Zn-dependent metalloprotease
MSKWNVRDVNVIIKEIEERTGEGLGLDVKVNGRLKRALARCLTKVVNGKHIPTKLEFGRTILEVEEYEIFRQITLHEIAHAIANKRHQANCGHDKRFKDVCRQIGCTNTGAYCSSEYALALQVATEKVYGKSTTTTTNKPQQQTTKYSVICKECGKVHHYKKMCQTLENLEGYRCACGGKLKLEQNW